MKEKHLVLVDICEALVSNKLNKARAIIAKELPYQPPKKLKRYFSEYKATEIFLRDGFIDRYSGNKLVFPPVLRLISEIFPEAFPFQTHWKLSECHIAYWHLSATLDHIIPTARSGDDSDDNLVTTSMLKNITKSIWLLEELGWELFPPGKMTEWDGLTRWFRDYVTKNPEYLKLSYIVKWHKALEQVLAEKPKEQHHDSQ
jgi:hypothetical protein